MLTADLVDVRRRGDELSLVAFEGERRQLADELARSLFRAAHARIGEPREDVEAALSAVDAPARARRLALGLRKILDDHATWEGASPIDPEVVRAAVFQRASVVRRELAEDARFDRDAILAEVATQMQTTSDELERAMFADLRSAEVLRAIDLRGPHALVETYAEQQVQAVLLRAVSVHVKLRCDGPGAYRAIFRQVKFLGLMHVLRAGEDGCYELDIDGPFSLFESVTKYGLKLALLVPVLACATSYELTAELRWGKGALVKNVRFKHRGGGGDAAPMPPLSDDAQALLDGLVAEKTPWRARVAESIVELPGIGLCVPDLALQHKKTGEVVHVELLGFWSRDAVWKRKALVEGGIGVRVVFVVSSHLRVSEALLDDDGAGALYVYKRVPSAKVLLERVDALAKRRVK